MVKLNGIELELDIMDLETSEKIEREAEIVVEEAHKAKGLKRSESIKKQCYAIFNCIDNIFGEGTHKKIFGNKVNLRDCLKVFAEFIDEFEKLKNEEEKELKSLTSKYSPNRAQRRNKKKSKNNKNYNKNRKN
ncbi:DUF6673 family protein [Clostridium baratii]|uniref:DUF6673 family protein n=1 Tax=Clostridium baratii TaxID=1561 RepID=UPI0030D5D7AE